MQHVLTFLVSCVLQKLHSIANVYFHPVTLNEPKPLLRHRQYLWIQLHYV